MPGIADLLGGDIVKAVIEGAETLITTDKERMANALENRKLDQAGDMAQIEVNKTEAASGKFWVAGWRPGIGWVGVIALFFAYVPKCIMLTGIWSYQAIVLVAAWKTGTSMPSLPSFPDLGITDLIGILMPMLGIGYMRHKEKLAGVAATAVGESPQPTPPNPFSAGQLEAP